MYNATNSDGVPTIPQPWTGPPRRIVQVQAILFASLAASLFSAFLAMLGKQWLSRYASVDMRGSAIERSQNRQRKFDGIVNWYFDHVMEWLPLMLQAALLLLGCALSRYLWEINITVASVVLGVTSFGVLSYLFIVVVGAAFVSCPYQTPGVHILRGIPNTLLRIQDALERIKATLLRLPDTLRRTTGIFHRIPDATHQITDTFRRIPHTPWMLHSFLSQHSMVYITPLMAWYTLTRRPSEQGSTPMVLVILLLPIWLIIDACKATVWLLDVSLHWLKREPEQRTGVLDLHCISWTLRTSLDGPVRLSALKYLATVTSADFDPTLVAGCFDVLFGCVKTIDNKAVITQAQESKQLVTESALYFLRMLPRLITEYPSVYEDIRQRYTRAFPSHTYFDHRTVPYTLDIIHTVFYSGPHAYLLHRWRVGKELRWEDYEPSSDEHVIVSHALMMVSRRFKYRKGGREKVPRWVLRFALHSLSQSPLPPISVVVNCLSIIAIDLGRDPLNKTTLDERCVCT